MVSENTFFTQLAEMTSFETLSNKYKNYSVFIKCEFVIFWLSQLLHVQYRSEVRWDFRV